MAQFTQKGKKMKAFWKIRRSLVKKPSSPSAS